MSQSNSKVINTLETSKPTTGVLDRDSLANDFKNKPSRAAAIGTWPCRSVQPFNAPKQEITCCHAKITHDIGIDTHDLESSAPRP